MRQMQIRAMEQRQEMNEIPKDELEMICERAAIETEHLEDADIAQKSYEYRVSKAKEKWKGENNDKK